MTDVVRVDYFKIVDMKLAQSKIDGWAYHTGGIELEVGDGDIVEVPPTPYSNGKNTRATVIHLGPDPCPWARKTIVRKLDSWESELSDAPQS